MSSEPMETPDPVRTPGPAESREPMAGPQRLAAVVALAASGFALLIAAMPTWTLPSADDTHLANRVPWWSALLIAEGNPLPAAAFGTMLVGFLLVLKARMRRRPSQWPIWLFGAAIILTLAGVLVGGRWFLVVNVIGVLFTALGMGILMVAKPNPRTPGGTGASG